LVYKRIDAIFVAKSSISNKNEYAILIQYGSELVELYYRTQDELEIVNQFNNLATEIKKAQSSFNLAGETALINYENVKQIEFIHGILNTKIIAKFNDAKLIRKGGNKKQYNKMMRDYKTAQYKTTIDL